MSRRLMVVAVGVVCLGATCGSLHAQARRNLFLDPAFIQQSENASLHVNPPQRREIVIRPDQPWEQLMISLFLTVRDDAGKLRMWYICRDKANRPNVAYAESIDGVRWTKPNLGLVEYAASKSNNLVGVFRDRKPPGLKTVAAFVPASAERAAADTHAVDACVFAAQGSLATSTDSRLCWGGLGVTGWHQDRHAMAHGAWNWLACAGDSQKPGSQVAGWRKPSPEAVMCFGFNYREFA